MINNILLLPSPRSLSFAGGQYMLEPGRRIVLLADETAALLFGARRLRAALRERVGVDWELSATLAGPAEEIGAVLRLTPGAAAHPQGYTLAISPEGVVAEAATPAGL